MQKCIFCKKTIFPRLHERVERYDAQYHEDCFILREDMYINSILNNDFETLEYINKVEGRKFIIIPKPTLHKETIQNTR
jgi:hypothetical protein